MENNERQFDQLFKERLENFEVPYEPTHWAEMEARLKNAQPVPKTEGTSWGKIITYGSSAAVIIAAAYFLFSPENKDNSPLAPQDNGQMIIMEDSEAATSSESPTKNGKETGSSAVQDSEIAQPAKPQNNTGDQGLTQSGPKQAANLEEQISRMSAQSSQQQKTQTENFMENHTDPKLKNDPATQHFQNQKLKTSIVVSDKVICAGEAIRFNTARDMDNVSYFWDFGDGGLTSTQKDPSRTFHKAGIFNVRLMVSGGEKNSFTVEEQIEVKANPDFEFEMDNSELTLHDPYTRFHINNIPSNTTFQWKIDDRSYQGSSIEHLFHSEGFHEVEVMGTKNGCFSTVKSNVNINRVAKFYIENTFTVNGDGINDEFPVMLREIEVPFDMSIYDKTNKLVFRTNDPTKPWNGRVNNNGDYVPQDFYNCVIITKDKYDKEHRFAQSVRVLRN